MPWYGSRAPSMLGIGSLPNPRLGPSGVSAEAIHRPLTLSATARRGTDRATRCGTDAVAWATAPGFWRALQRLDGLTEGATC